MKKVLSVWLMAVLYIGAGILHFVRPEIYVRIVPTWIPDAAAAVFWSGVAEVALGVALLSRKTRSVAAIGIIVLLVAVFPANVQMAKDWVASKNPSAWIAIVRLPLQALLIWWAWKVRRR